jgi:hypothetical protein
VEGELPGRDGGVDPLVQHAQVDAAAFEVGDQLDEVGDRATEPVELRDHDDVTGAGVVEQRIELRPAGELARGAVSEGAFAAGGGEGVVLAVGVLLDGADAAERQGVRVQDPATAARTRRGRGRSTRLGRGRSTRRDTRREGGCRLAA